MLSSERRDYYSCYYGGERDFYFLHRVFLAEDKLLASPDFYHLFDHCYGYIC